MLDPGVFATVFAGLYVAHGVADHWLQTSEQDRGKSLPGWEGRAACASHVLPYVALAALFVVGLQELFGLPLHWYWIGAGLVVSGATHYWADRRTTLARLCERLGKGDFYRLGAPREVEAQRYISTTGREVVRLNSREGSDERPPPIQWDNPTLGTGAYALDQWWHIFWTFAAALVMVIA